MEVLPSDRLASGISIENSAQELVKLIKEGCKNKGRRVDGNCDDGDNCGDLAPVVHLDAANGSQAEFENLLWSLEGDSLGFLFDKCLYSRPHEHGMSKSQLGRDKVDAQWLQLLPDNYLRACTCLNALRSRGQNEAEDFFCRSTLHKKLPLPLLSNDTYHYSNKAVRHQIRVAQLDFKPLLNAGADSSRWIRAAGLCKLSWTIHSAA